MSSPIYFELGGVAVPMDANLVINQRYESLMGASDKPVRMMNGDAYRQVTWSGKLRTVITVNGFWPSGFDGLDFSQSMLLKCAGGRTLSSATNAIALPTERRSETYFEPHGYAVVDGKVVESPTVVASDVATITTVSGATQYGVVYYPEITVIANPVRTGAQLDRPEFDWALEAEEV